MIQTLNMIKIMKVNPIVIVSGVAMLFLSIPMFRLFSRTDKPLLSAVSLFLGVILLGVGSALILTSNAPEMKISTGKYRIEATISDDIPFNAVYDQYEIIEKRGDIYLLEPKVYDFDEEKG